MVESICIDKKMNRMADAILSIPPNIDTNIDNLSM
jgi:hypothetical protein